MLERNIARFKDDDLAEAVMADVAVRPVELLGIKIDKQRRQAARRREENTEVFCKRYKIRGGIEGTNSGSLLTMASFLGSFLKLTRFLAGATVV